MKLRFFFAIVCFCGVFEAKSQESTFLSPDQPPKCQKIKEGKFIRTGKSPKIWHMIIKNGVQKEYYNNGKDYMKSKLEFVDDCRYKIIITGKTEGKNSMRIGDIVMNEIIETDHHFLRISSKYYNTTEEFVLEKIE